MSSTCTIFVYYIHPEYVLLNTQCTLYRLVTFKVPLSRRQASLDHIAELLTLCLSEEKFICSLDNDLSAKVYKWEPQLLDEATFDEI